MSTVIIGIFIKNSCYSLDLNSYIKMDLDGMLSFST